MENQTVTYSLQLPSTRTMFYLFVAAVAVGALVKTRTIVLVKQA